MNKFADWCGPDLPGWLHVFLPFMILLLVWGMFWKGLALWHAGRRGHPWWFVILLLVNTVGILELVYLFAVLKIKFSQLFKK